MLEVNHLSALHPYNLLISHAETTAGNSQIVGLPLFTGGGACRTCLEKLPRKTWDSRSQSSVMLAAPTLRDKSTSRGPCPLITVARGCFRHNHHPSKATWSFWGRQSCWTRHLDTGLGNGTKCLLGVDAAKVHLCGAGKR